MSKKLENLKTFEGFFGDKINVDAECDTCKDGKVRCINCSSEGRDREACGTCKGTGYVDCPDCNGLSDCSCDKKATNENYSEDIEVNDTLAYEDLSDEAKVDVKGMVEYCINHGVVMGMDEGYVDYEQKIKHPFRIELEKFSGYKEL